MCNYSLAKPTRLPQSSGVSRSKRQSSKPNIIMNAIEKSVAELNISNAIKSGDTRNILRHIGSSWTGEPESFPRFTRSLEQAVSAIRALGESIADSCEDIEVENAAADQSEALAKGMLSAAKSAMLSEIEKIVSATYSCRD